MKIDSGVKSVGSPAGLARQGPAGATPRQPNDAGEAARVEISSLSARLQVAGAAMDATAPADASRIAEIKQAIAEGRFSMNPERIADGLLKSVHEMLTSGRAQ